MFIGLCAGCRYIKPIKSARGSLFVMCLRAKTDPRLNKYPVLPMLHCVGFEEAPPLSDAPPKRSEPPAE